MATTSTASGCADRQEHDTPPTDPDALLTWAGRQAPVLRDRLERHGGLGLHAYVDREIDPADRPLQPRDDLVEAMRAECERLLGAPLAAALAEDLERQPVALTTNHHGVDYFAQSVQGNLALSRRSGARDRAATVPVLACGTVPLDNLTYPLGMLFYDSATPELEPWPRRMPVFSNKVRRHQVSLAPPLDEAGCHRAADRSRGLAAKGEIPAGVSEVAATLIEEEYLRAEVLDLDSYSDQAVVLNHRLWRRIHASATDPAELVCLELERVATRLLVDDLRSPGSLAHAVLLDPGICRRVVAALDRDRSCWELAVLSNRLHASAETRTKGGGTMFFWGVTNRGRRVPMLLRERRNAAELVGIDDGNVVWRIPVEANALADALLEGRLLPSIFSSFLVTALARGLVCMGGYYQGAYLPRMRDAVAGALHATGHVSEADRSRAVRADAYLAGVQAVMRAIPGGALVPAGVLEILEAGGLTDADLARVDALSLRDAHLASMLETCPELAGSGQVPAGWAGAVASACASRLESSVVIK